MTDYPLRRGVLRSLREVRNLSLGEAADLIGIDAAHLHELEEGGRQPTLGLLRKIANKYQFPLATLGHERPLEPREPVTDFRTIEGAPATLGPALSVAVDEARQIQSFAAELIEEDANLYLGGLSEAAAASWDARAAPGWLPSCPCPQGRRARAGVGRWPTRNRSARVGFQG